MPNNFGEFGWIFLLLLLGVVGFIIKSYVSFLSDKIACLEKKYDDLNERITTNEKNLMKQLNSIKDDFSKLSKEILEGISNIKVILANDYVKKEDL